MPDAVLDTIIQGDAQQVLAGRPETYTKASTPDSPLFPEGTK